MTVAVRKMDRIYALYKGDEYVCDGTISEISKHTGESRDYLNWMTTPSAQKRARGTNRLQMEKLDDD